MITHRTKFKNLTWLVFSCLIPAHAIQHYTYIILKKVFFQLSRGITLTKIIELWPKTNLTCLCLWLSLTINFQANVTNCLGDNEQKLTTSSFFPQKLKGHNSVKIIELWPNMKLTCVYLWHINMLNLGSMCTSVW
jgi:hypothetical protein